MVGDEPEREWAANVCQRIRTKADGLASGNVLQSRPPLADLVLYENGPTSVGVHLPKALRISCARFWTHSPAAGSEPIPIIADSFRRLIDPEAIAVRCLFLEASLNAVSYWKSMDIDYATNLGFPFTAVLGGDHVRDGCESGLNRMLG